MKEIIAANTLWKGLEAHIVIDEVIAALERSARWRKTESEVLLPESQATSDFYRSEAELIYAHIDALRDLTSEEWWITGPEYRDMSLPRADCAAIVRERLERKP